MSCVEYLIKYDFGFNLCASKAVCSILPRSINLEMRKQIVEKRCIFFSYKIF
jgi:hypothetical protein